ncbi:MAG: hypothetical protein WC822_06530 [Candidatus Paceibacterota bacterium]
MRTLEEQIAQKCRHFNGLMNEACDVGVRYEDVRDTTVAPHRFPCLKGETLYGGFCVKASFPTPEEVAAEVKEIDDELRQWNENMANNICPHCKKPMHKYQVGRCVYASPCGHRLYQGRLR